MHPTSQTAPLRSKNTAGRPVRLYIPFIIYALVSLPWLPGLGATLRTWLATAGLGSAPTTYDAENVSVDAGLIFPTWIALGVTALIVALIITRAKHVPATATAYLISTVGFLSVFLALSYWMF